MQTDSSDVVALIGGLAVIWFFVNCVVPIRALGIRSRKYAFMLLICSVIVVSVAHTFKGEAPTADNRQSRPPVTEQPPTTVPKENSTSDLSELAGDKSRQEVWIIKGQEAVQEKLKDASSAQFRKAFFHLAKLDGGYVPVSCGQVNSKNSFGGYSGFQRYISGGQPDLTFLEEETADFSKVWKLVCVD